MSGSYLKSAIDAMRSLNAEFKNEAKGELKIYIMSLKDIFIDYLYLNGYCNSVKKQDQIVYCKNPIHFMGKDRVCSDCNGSGIYAVNTMFVYMFSIDGSLFTFHQPKRNAITKPVVCGDHSEIEKSKRHINVLGSITNRIFLVRSFLRNYDYDIPPLDENVVMELGQKRELVVRKYIKKSVT